MGDSSSSSDGPGIFLPACIITVVFLLLLTIFSCVMCYVQSERKRKQTENLAQQVDRMQPGDEPPPWPVITRCTNPGKTPARYEYIQTYPERAYLPERTLPQTPAPAPYQYPVPAPAPGPYPYPVQAPAPYPYQVPAPAPAPYQVPAPVPASPMTR